MAPEVPEGSALAAPPSAAAALDPELAPLVERTRGVQPLRRLFHAANGLLVALLPPRLGLDREELVWALAALLAALAAADLVRLRVRRVNALFFSLFPSLASPREAARVASSTWYVAGLLITWALFPPRLALPATLVLALADPTASVAGRVWGRRRFGKGTVLGSAVFLVVAAPVLGASAGAVAGIVAGLLVMMVEVAPWRLDDNLTVPVAAAAALWLLGG